MMEKGPASMCAGRAEDNLSSGQNKMGSDGSFERLKTNLGPSIKSIKTQMNKFSNLPKKQVSWPGAAAAGAAAAETKTTARSYIQKPQLYTGTGRIKNKKKYKKDD